MTTQTQSITWTGVAKPHLDKPFIQSCGHVTLACYGGNRDAGAHKNEDAAFILTADDASWTFSALCDAHFSSQSAVLVVDCLQQIKEDIANRLSQPVDQAFVKLEHLILSTLLSPSFQQDCQTVQGETALLLCAQKGTFLWWLAVGDNLIYLFHPDVAKMGQFALNQRHFFEWVGQVNSLALPIPCYSRGVTELRKGINHILLLTDGVLEFPNSPYTNGENLYTLFHQHPQSHAQSLSDILTNVHRHKGRDSATMISFSVDVGDYTGAIPSNYPS